MHDFKIASGGDRSAQDQLGDAADARRILVSILDVLSAKERAAVVLRDLEGMDICDVAALMGCRKVTVRAYLSRARLKLRNAARPSGGVQ